MRRLAVQTGLQSCTPSFYSWSVYQVHVVNCNLHRCLYVGGFPESVVVLLVICLGMKNLQSYSPVHLSSVQMFERAEMCEEQSSHISYTTKRKWFLFFSPLISLLMKIPSFLSGFFLTSNLKTIFFNFPIYFCKEMCCEKLQSGEGRDVRALVEWLHPFRCDLVFLIRFVC